MYNDARVQSTVAMLELAGDHSSSDQKGLLYRKQSFAFILIVSSRHMYWNLAKRFEVIQNGFLKLVRTISKIAANSLKRPLKYFFCVCNN
jgi:hypothetical protein